MAGVTFTVGLLLGLILHLPGASSPHSRHIRSSDSLPQELYGSMSHPVVHSVQNEPAISVSVGAARSLLSDNTRRDNVTFTSSRRTYNRLSQSRKHSRRKLYKNNAKQKGVTMNLDTSDSRHKHSKHSNQKRKHRKEPIGNIQQLLTPPRVHNIKINISSRSGNGGVVSEKGLLKGIGNSGKRSEVKEKQLKENEKETNFIGKSLPEGEHISVDIYDKLQNTQQVEMSVSVIDVATGSEPLKKPSHIMANDRQTTLGDNLESHRTTPDQVSHKSAHGHFTQLWQIVDGIYWTPQLERLTPKGFGEIETTKWRQHAQNSKVREIREGCGRMQNRLVVYNDGSKMCARYRINTDQIQGEVYSYYLAKTLGIDNVLPPILTKVNPSSPQWSSVLGAIDSAQWNSQKVFVLTPWLENLQPVYIPEELHSDNTLKLSPLSQSLVNKSIDQLTELVQWTDLIVLDYLTANVDRVVNNMFNLQWNSGMMKAPTHNLERVGQTGALVFLDNESGLLHSYRLLDKYEQYHEQLLRSVCVFRQSTAQQIKKLFQGGDITHKLKTKFSSMEPLANSFAFIPQQNLSVLSQRLANVYRQIISCERTYANKKS